MAAASAARPLCHRGAAPTRLRHPTASRRLALSARAGKGATAVPAQLGATRAPGRSRLSTARKRGVLRRLIQYAEKGYGRKSLLAGVSDCPPHPRCRRVDAGAVLGPAGQPPFSRGPVLEEMAGSAPQRGHHANLLVDTAVLRQAIRQLYERLKRNKALPGIGGLGVAVIDGPHASYRRCCGGCLERRIQRSDCSTITAK